jgi:superfamily II DNA or RNA helicase
MGITNYSTYSYNVMQKITDDELRDAFIIFDEAHRIKNINGKWGKTAFKITRKCREFVLLSATLHSNGFIDYANYFKMFGYCKNMSDYLKRYTNFYYNHFNAVVITSQKDNMITDAWKQISSRLNKEECAELPSLQFIDKRFSDNNREYHRALKDRVYKDKILDNPMKLRHTLRSILSTAKTRADWVKDFVKDHEDNVVVFYNYDNELKVLKKVFQHKTIHEVNGHNKTFHSDDCNSQCITLANYKSGSEGVEFSYANVIVYFSLCESYTDYYQSYGRCHRNGQTKRVICYRLYNDATIEEDIKKALDNKEDFNFSKWEKERTI